MGDLERPDGFKFFLAALSLQEQRELVAALESVIAAAPLYTPTMPKSGKPLSVQMTNCGKLGWVSSKELGYRYQAEHPVTALPWPEIPADIMGVWERFADASQPPEACLVNWYAPTARLGLHVDRDEDDFSFPVLSISLGDDAWFRVGGLKRRDPTKRVLLRSGDVVVMGGAARLIHHGVDRIVAGSGTLLTNPGRFNLTLRRVTPAGLEPAA